MWLLGSIGHLISSNHMQVLKKMKHKYTQNVGKDKQPKMKPPKAVEKEL